MKDKLRNTGCPEAISMAILGHSTNTVAANYGSGYALEVMREHMERVWDWSNFSGYFNTEMATICA
jgi:hypothetical protein